MSETKDLQHGLPLQEAPQEISASTETGQVGAPHDSTPVDTLTRAKQDSFLEAFAIVGNVAGAAAATGLHRSTHYLWMKDSDYALRFQEAEEEFRDSIRNEVRVRAVDGWLEPVVYQGRIQFVEERDENGEVKLDAAGRPIAHVVAVRKKSDRILELLAKAKVPEFKDKVEHSGRLTLEQILGGGSE